MSIPESARRSKLGHVALATLGLFVMLAATLVIAPSDAEAQWGSHICIEDDLVQDSPSAEGMSVGNMFATDHYDVYTITKGGPTCTLDPSTCDSSLNLYLVDDVKKCLEEAADAADDAADAAAHAEPTGSLAHTGLEHQLAGAFATALIGAGCASLGLARAGRRRRNL